MLAHYFTLTNTLAPGSKDRPKLPLFDEPTAEANSAYAAALSARDPGTFAQSDESHCGLPIVAPRWHSREPPFTRALFASYISIAAQLLPLAGKTQWISFSSLGYACARFIHYNNISIGAAVIYNSCDIV